MKAADRAHPLVALGIGALAGVCAEAFEVGPEGGAVGAMRPAKPNAVLSFVQPAEILAFTAATYRGLTRNSGSR